MEDFGGREKKSYSYMRINLLDVRRIYFFEADLFWSRSGCWTEDWKTERLLRRKDPLP